MAHEFIAVHLDLFSHPKFLHLVRLVGRLDTAVHRLLMCWTWVARHAPSGTLNERAMDGLRDAIGEVTLLHLIEAGFLDIADGNSGEIHGWDEWQPYWSARQKMSAAGRAGAAKRWGANSHPITTPSGNHDRVPIAKESEKEKEKQQTTLVNRANGTPVDRRWLDWFDNQFWPRYPRKVARKAALAAWVALRPKNSERWKQSCSMILTALERDKAEQWHERRPELIPHPATWLRRESFAEADVLEES